MPLCTEVDLRLGHIVLDDDPGPPERDTATWLLSSFRSMKTVVYLSYCSALVLYFPKTLSQTSVN